MSLLLIAHFISLALSFPSFQNSMPNGDRVTRNGVAWPGVGHFAAGGGGPRNAFGTAFQAAGRQWTKALCEQDSDGDGQSNGFELGDPNCEWTVGATPARITDISHPGFSDSTTSAVVASPTLVPTLVPTPTPTFLPTPAPTEAQEAPAVPTEVPAPVPTSAPTFAITPAPTQAQETSAAPTPGQVPTPSPTPVSSLTPVPSSPEAPSAPTPVTGAPTPCPSSESSGYYGGRYLRSECKSSACRMRPMMLAAGLWMVLMQR